MAAFEHCLVIPLPLLSIDDDLVRIPVADKIIISNVYASFQALAAGTFTVQLKTASSTSTIAVTSAKTNTALGSSLTVESGDTLRIGSTGIGTGAVAGTVVVWYRLARE